MKTEAEQLKRKHDFQAMLEMSQADLDISVSPDCLECKKVKNGYHVTFGVTPQVGEKIMSQLQSQVLGGELGYASILTTVNYKQFKQFKDSPDTLESDREELLKALEEALFIVQHDPKLVKTKDKFEALIQKHRNPLRQVND